MAIFELIIEAPNTTFTIVSFHITKSSIAFLFLPALVAYLYLQTFIDTNRMGDAEIAFSSTFNKWLPLSKSNDLDVLALPSQPLYWSFAPSMQEANKDSTYKLDETIGYIIVFIYLLGGIAFEVQAYYLLYSQSSSHLVLYAISALITFLFATGCNFAFWMAT